MVELQATQEALAVWEKVKFGEHMVKFITFLFSIITGMGLMQFAKSQFSSDILDGKRPDFRNLALFIACLFFLVTDWFFFQYLVTKYPYTHPLGIYRFAIDIIIFCLMYLLLYAATQTVTLYRMLLILGTLAVWHLLAQAWHIVRLFEHSQNPVAYTHLYRAVTYGVVLATGVHYANLLKLMAPEQMDKAGKNVICVLIDCVVLLIFYFNGTRLWYFIIRGPYPSQKLRFIDGCVCALVALLGYWHAIRLKQQVETT